MLENQWETTSDHSCRIFLKNMKHLIYKTYLQDVKIDYHPNLWWYISSEVVGWQIPAFRQHGTLLILHLTSSVSENQGSTVILFILYYAQPMYWFQWHGEVTILGSPLASLFQKGNDTSWLLCFLTREYLKIIKVLSSSRNRNVVPYTIGSILD